MYMNSRRVRASQDYCHGTKRKPCKPNKLHLYITEKVSVPTEREQVHGGVVRVWCGDQRDL